MYDNVKRWISFTDNRFIEILEQIHEFGPFAISRAPPQALLFATVIKNSWRHIIKEFPVAEDLARRKRSDLEKARGNPD
jgi:hypothetical protein